MRNQRGSGLIEFVVALGVLTVCLVAATIYVANAMQGTKRTSDKDFAVQKAISILEELKGVFESKTGNDATLLDGFDDGTTTSTVLTIQDGVTAPDHPSSGNVHDGARWKFERRISVSKFASVQSNDVRLVSVRVYAWQQGQRVPLAEVSSVIRTIADAYPPTQVYDVYCLAIENVPGWWVYMANLIPFVENAISDLQARNPGLEFRTHWIRKLAYGRDRTYVPYVNDAADSEQAIDWVYFYPGALPAGSAVNYYYVPTGIDARINVDGTEINGYDPVTNPHPYAFADTYNHAMRYADEKALFEARVAAGVESAAEPTWRLLIEDMFTHPEDYENAIFINVHGELFPFPPLRNFSDPAKDPASRPEVRAVTHPEQLRYTNSDDVRLRVYSYLTDPDDSTLPDRLDVPVSVLIKGYASLPGLSVTAIEGGFDLDPADGLQDPYVTNGFDVTEDYPGDMYYEVTNVTEGVLVKLYNSPLRHGCPDGNCTNGGLDATKRLYDLEYLPFEMSSGTGDFSRNLTDAQDRTKNTARWVITIPEGAITDDAVMTIETRIGDDLGHGALFPVADRPANLSRTYVYRGSDTWVFGDGSSANPPHLPLTERFQVMGDPRHMPYADLRKPYDPVTNPLGDGYNRYFDDFHDGAGNMASDPDYWPGFANVKNNGDPADDGWASGSGSLEIEVHRCFQMLRDALLKAHAVYTTMTGFSYYYLGVGNEIGYDCDNGFCNSIPVSEKPFNGGTGSLNEMTITTALNGGVKYVRSNETGNDWWALHWLGELYPDAEWTGWLSQGNLPTGSGSGTYVRARRDTITAGLPRGTSLQRTVRRLTEEGATSFFSIGTSSSKFHHQYQNGRTGDLTGDGLDIADNYNFPIPATVDINRPFNLDLNGAGGVPDHYQDPLYYAGTLSGSATNHFYDHESSGVLGSSMIKLDGSLDEDHSFVVVNGLAQTQFTGSAFMGRWSFLTLIQGFLAAGLQSGNERIVQVPRVEVTQPNDLTDLTNPASVTVAWTNEWRRWDGDPYTSSYTDGFTESASLSYTVIYSKDNGKTWFHAQDDSPATPGVRPTNPAHLESGSTFSWGTPSGNFPKGTYLVRVEAYRDGKALHYAYHQRRIFIKR